MEYCAYICASIAGLVLFCIGIIGLSGAPFALSPSVSVLLEPLGRGAQLDTIYYAALIVLGIWLVLYMQARLAALLALVLVLVKVVIV